MKPQDERASNTLVDPRDITPHPGVGQDEGAGVTTETAAGVALVIVHFGDPALTAAALRSAVEGAVTPELAVVVDNGPGRFVPPKRWATTEVRIVRPRHNVGFARGVNIALDRLPAKIDRVWLLNNDAVADRFALTGLLRAHAMLPSALISSRVLTDDSTPWFGSAVFLPWRLEGRHYRREWPAPANLRTLGVHVAPRTVGVLRINYLPFCSVLAPFKLFESVGPLDPTYFVYGEDVDFCARAQRAGWELAIATQSVVHHRISAATNPSEREYLKSLTAALLVWRHYPWLLPHATAGGLATGIVRAIRWHEHWQVTSRVRAYADAIARQVAEAPR